MAKSPDPDRSMRTAPALEDSNPSSAPPRTGACKASTPSSDAAPSSKAEASVAPAGAAQSGPAPATAAEPILATGWHELSDEVYHGDPCPTPSLSSHVANLVIGKSLMHAWRAHPRSPLFEESAMGSAADRGSAAHSVLFGGRTIEAIDAEDYRTAAAREARETARARGRIPLLAKELAGLSAMIEPARQRFHDLHGGPFLCERSAIWRVGEGGWRRARLDTISPCHTLIVDYKTTEGAVDALSCERRIADMGAQIQAAAYVEAVEALHPELMGRVRFVFQWQEQKPPYALSPPIEMSEAFLTLGRAQWRAACQLWDHAIRQGAFPGYSVHPHQACPPPWELARWDDRERLGLSDTIALEIAP